VRVPALLAFIFVLCANAFAGAGIVEVVVTDSSGAPIRGALVTVSNSNGRDARMTDSTGRTAFPCDKGSDLQASAVGFEQKRTTLDNCDDNDISFSLEPAVVHTAIDVVVTDADDPTVATGTAAQIDRTAARTVFDAIEELSPSVFVTRRGVMGYGISPNGAGAVNIRGIGGSPNTDVLVVIDGRPDYQGLFGHPLPDFYNLSDAGTIRVVQGPASVLYGTNAMGGVVEIEPREPEYRPEFRLTSSVGSYWTGQHRIWTGTRTDKATLSLAGGIDHTNGDRENSAFRSQDISTGFAYEVTPAWEVSLNGNYAHFLVEDPGPITAPLQDSYASIGRGGFTAGVANRTQSLNGYIRAFSTWGRNFVSDGFRSVDRITGGRVFQSFKASENASIDGGFEVVSYGGRARNISGPNFGDHEITDTAGFGRFHWSASRVVRLNAGVRYQHDSVFGNIAVPEFGLVLDPVERVSLSFAVSRGFRNPTVRELFLFPAPNPELEPAKLWNYQGTLQVRPATNIVAWATLFYADLDDNIVTIGRFPNLALRNTGQAINKGVETNVRWSVSRFVSASLGYAYLTSTNLAPLVPRHKAIASMEVNLRRAFLHVALQGLGRRFADFRQTDELAGYVFGTAKISVPVSRNVDAFATVDNLLNRRYEVLPGYPMPGTNAAAGFALHF